MRAGRLMGVLVAALMSAAILIGPAIWLAALGSPAGSGRGRGEEPADALTVAAKIATGAESWANVMTPASHDAIGRSVAVSPDSGNVYIVVQDFTTGGVLPHGRLPGLTLLLRGPAYVGLLAQVTALPARS